MSERWKQAGVAMLAAALTVLAGCASGPDPVIDPVAQRLAAAEGDPAARAHAAAPLADATLAIQRAKEAGEAGLRRHFAYLADRNLDIVDALVERQQAAHPPADASPAARAPEPEPEKMPASAAPTAEGGDEASKAERDLIREMKQEQARREMQGAEGQPDAGPDTDTAPTGGHAAAPPVLVEVPQIRFAEGATSLTPGHRRRLEPLVLRMRDLPSLSVVVEGYTDKANSQEAALRISLARANAVKSFLTANGVAPGRVQTLGLGTQYPVAGNDTADGRQQNRRVEIVVSPGPLQGSPPEASSSVRNPAAAERTSAPVTPPEGAGENATPQPR